MSTVTVTVSKDNQNNERQSFKNTIKTTKYMLSFVLKEKQGRTYTLLMLLTSFMGIFPTIVYTLFPGLIINELIDHHTIYKLCVYIGVLIVTPVLYQIFNRLAARQMTKIKLRLSAVFSKRFNYHTAMMDYDTIEKPDIQTMSSRVSGTYQNAVSIIDQLGALISAVLSLIAVISIIATINIFIIFLVLAVVFINALITQRLNQKLFINNKRISEYDRYNSNLLIVLHYISYAKEVRLFNLKSYFSQLLFNKRNEKDDIQLENKTNNLNAQILFSLTNLLQQAVLYIYIVYRVIFTGLPVGSMTIYMSAVSQFAGAFNGVINGYLQLSKKSLDIQEMISFLDIPLKQQSLSLIHI